MILKQVALNIRGLSLSKVLLASCLNQVVKVENIAVDASIFSEGKAASTGCLLIDKENAYYFTSSASDIKNTITLLNTLLNQVVTVLTGLDGVSTSPGSQAANILSLTNLITQFNATKDNLK